MHIVIIGNGISGITAARHIRKRSNHRITVISAETTHFFSRTALMYIYMGHMTYEQTKPYEDWFWEKNRIELLNKFVDRVDTGHKKLLCSDGSNITYDKLILAVGSKSRKFGWKGENLQHVQGLYSYQDLEAMETASENLKHAVIVGGGLIGIEMAEMFHTRKIPVTMLVREESYWRSVLPKQEAEIVKREIAFFGIEVRYNTELKEILDDGNGKVKGIVTSQGKEIACGFVGLTIGVQPNIDFLQGSGVETDRGILVNEFLETNILDVYAIGDCTQFKIPINDRKPIEQVWYTGRMQGETLAATICGKRTAYQPGPWFNSAKFFHIEYQTYGKAPANMNELQEELYWEHPSGKKCIHIFYEKDTHQLLGINLLGIRYKHEVCNEWLEKRSDMQEVLINLHKANFDPEFFRTYEHKIVELYNKKHPDRAIAYKRKKGWLEKIFG
ncbi:FAD-dependent oxidoreductase [Limibacter armeniacum]|uniref:NAD(P)/FAD-dependent oxidoreductase n=1 Tax=Limibacter armeniacum TaxID=466084 RepID=UPI002FE5AA92